MPSSIEPTHSHASTTTRPIRRLAALVAVVALAAGLVGAQASIATAAPADCRVLPVDADADLRSDLARAEFDVDGTGVKVGIISNSYSLAGPAAIAENVAGGLLPGPGNPCGWLTPVTELFPSPAGYDDEGRAMAQLVHGVAPGAELYFAPSVGDGTSDTNQGGMLQAIKALVDKHVDVIVDDITFVDEPFFQESLVSARIAELEAEGIVYLTAAGNETVVAAAPLPGQPVTPVNGWSTTAFRPSACESYVETAVKAETQYADAVFDCMDFSHDGTPDSTARFGAITDQLPHNTEVFETSALMQWGEQYGALTGAFEMVITVLKTSGTGAGGVACTVSDPCTASGLIPALDTTTPARYVKDIAMPIYDTVTDIEVSLVRITQKDATSPVVDLRPAIGFVFPNNGDQWIQYAEYAESAGTDLVGRSVIGHNGAPGAITIAATGYRARDAIEPYSSLGPVRYTLSSQAQSPQTLLPEPVTHHLPELVSVDGVRQTVLMTYPVPGEPGVGYFYGTSAATPNAGAVVALALQLDPELTTTEARTFLRETATTLPSPYADVSVEDSVGAGLVNAQAFLQRVSAELPPPVPGTPGIQVLPATGAADAAGLLATGAFLALAGAALVLLRRRARA